MPSVPFWVNTVDKLPHERVHRKPHGGSRDVGTDDAAEAAPTSHATGVRIGQLFDCAARGDECWSAILLANFMIDMTWLMQAAPGIARVRDTLLVLSGEEGVATAQTNFAARGVPHSWTATDKAHARTLWTREYTNAYLAAAEQHGLSGDKVVVLEPPLPFPYGTHHTKMALCVNELGLRVVITTANFIYSDWESKTQGVYVQDFPRRSLQTRATAVKPGRRTPRPRSDHTALAKRERESEGDDGDDEHAEEWRLRHTRGADFALQLRRYLAHCGVGAPSSARTSTAHTHTDTRKKETIVATKETQTTTTTTAAAKQAKEASVSLGIFAENFLDEFDFDTAAVWIVSSVPGSFTGVQRDYFGQNRLARVISTILQNNKNNNNSKHPRHSRTARTRKSVAANHIKQEEGDDEEEDGVHAAASLDEAVLSWQYSSQGSLHDRFLNCLQLSMIGLDMNATPVVTKARKTKQTRTASTAATATAAVVAASVAPRSGPLVQIIYPTEEEVRMSLEGWRGGLSLPVYTKNMHPFVRARLHRWGIATANRSSSHLSSSPPSSSMLLRPAHYRRYALPHIKSYALLDPRRQFLHWFMLTSANLSQAAWGTLSNISKGEDKLFIRSYEMGVVYDAASAWVQNSTRLARASSTSTSSTSVHTSSTQPHAQTATRFSTTPSLPSIELARHSDALMTTKMHAAGGTSTLLQQSSSTALPAPDAETAYIMLPYDICHCVPYRASSLNQHTVHTADHSSSSRDDKASDMTVTQDAKNRSVQQQEEDVPWCVDAPHLGKDSLGKTTKQVLSDYSFYGPESWSAPTRVLFDELGPAVIDVDE